MAPRGGGGGGGGADADREMSGMLCACSDSGGAAARPRRGDDVSPVDAAISELNSGSAEWDDAAAIGMPTPPPFGVSAATNGY